MIDIRHSNLTKYIMILEDFTFVVGGVVYTIPKNFIFDGGSIPRLFWILSHPLYYKHLEAFLIHDFLYSNYFKERVKEGKYIDVSRKRADNQLKVRLKNPFISKYFYYAVRLFGWINYKRPLPLYIKKEIYV